MSSSPSPSKSPLAAMVHSAPVTLGRVVIVLRTVPFMSQSRFCPVEWLRQIRSDQESPLKSPAGGCRAMLIGSENSEVFPLRVAVAVRYSLVLTLLVSITLNEALHDALVVALVAPRKRLPV